MLAEIDWLQLFCNGVAKFICGAFFIVIICVIISIAKNPACIKAFFKNLMQRRNPPDSRKQ